jgi:hypothetical protein
MNARHGPDERLTIGANGPPSAYDLTISHWNWFFGVSQIQDIFCRWCEHLCCSGDLMMATGDVSSPHASQRVRCTGMTIYKIPQPIASPHPRTKRASLDCSPFLRCLLELRGTLPPNLGFYPRLAEGRFNPELPLTRELFRRLRQQFQPNASLCIFTNRIMAFGRV